MGLVVAGWVYVTPQFRYGENEYPFYYYVICLLINMAHTVFAYTMFVSQMSFYAQISDKSIGGTYMTFLNTISNLGGVWPQTLALYLANFLTFKYCSSESLKVDPKSDISNSTNFTQVIETIKNNTCASEVLSKECVSLGGLCVTTIDAYYIETVACTVFAIFWIFQFKDVMYKLQNIPKSAWKLN